ncbi:MAG: rhodanese-like domain-containing protein [Flavobacteriaceae bacterium]|nr:rhodanese-like domain-containing protein [Bacteroidia bacterium]NNK69788.1 rhodanese-like domain-containing protein [Flavobacteriaceae bacterium]
MKELEKTKNISVATVLAILVIIIGLLSYKKPKHIYSESVEATLISMTSLENVLSKDKIDDNSFLVDVRTSFEYSKGHIGNAINISLPDILSDQNVQRLKDAVEESKTIVFYSSDVNDALSAKMLIDQLGYAKTKVLAVELNYEQDELVIKDLNIENSPQDIQAFIDKSVKEAEAKNIVEVKPIPKKVIPRKKKKKMPVEGGC